MSWCLWIQWPQAYTCAPSIILYNCGRSQVVVAAQLSLMKIIVRGLIPFLIIGTVAPCEVLYLPCKVVLYASIRTEVYHKLYQISKISTPVYSSPVLPVPYYLWAQLFGLVHRTWRKMHAATLFQEGNKITSYRLLCSLIHWIERLPGNDNICSWAHVSTEAL